MHELDSLRESLLEGEIDRASFLRKALGLGLSLSAAGALFAAWGQASASAPRPPSAAACSVFARNFEPVTLGPFGAADNGTIWTIMMIYDQLVEYAPGKLDPQPGLAKSWDFSNGGKTIMFHLRDAKFSNGAPVTADDVVFSLNRFKDPKVNNLLPFLATSIASVSAPNPKTVVMKLKRPDGAILSNLSVFPASITPKAVVTKMGDKAFALNPVGSGPFVVDDWKRGQYLKMSRNPHYWRSGQPYLDGVEFDYITNDNTRILSLQSGQVDVAESIPFSQVDSLNKGSTRVEVAPLASIDAHLAEQHAQAVRRQARPPGAELRDRQGRDQPRRLLRPRRGRERDLPVLQVHRQVVKNYPYDMDKAKALLAKSSAPKGFDVTILIPSEDQTKAQMMAVVKQLWSKLGVNVTIQSMETNALFTKYMNGDYEASDPLPSITADVLVPDELALAWLDPKGVQKGFWSFYKSQKAWDLTLQANSTTDEAKRKQVFGQIQKLTLADAPWVPLFFVPARTGLGSKVQNFHTLESGWWNLWEVWKS